MGIIAIRSWQKQASANIYTRYSSSDILDERAFEHRFGRVLIIVFCV